MVNEGLKHQVTEFTHKHKQGVATNQTLTQANELLQRKVKAIESTINNDRNMQMFQQNVMDLLGAPHLAQSRDYLGSDLQVQIEALF